MELGRLAVRSRRGAGGPRPRLGRVSPAWRRRGKRGAGRQEAGKMDPEQPLPPAAPAAPAAASPPLSPGSALRAAALRVLPGPRER